MFWFICLIINLIIQWLYCKLIDKTITFAKDDNEDTSTLPYDREHTQHIIIKWWGVFRILAYASLFLNAAIIIWAVLVRIR